MTDAIYQLERLADIAKVEAARASIICTASGRFAVRDVDGVYVVRGAMSIAEAARLFAEDEGRR